MVSYFVQKKVGYYEVYKRVTSNGSYSNEVVSICRSYREAMRCLARHETLRFVVAVDNVAYFEPIMT